MKKILILFFILYNFAYSADSPTFNAWTSGECPSSFYDGPYFFYNRQSSGSPYAGNGGGENYYLLYDYNSGSKCMYQYSVYTNSSTNNSQDYVYSRVNYSCDDGFVFDESSHSCISPAPTCLDNQHLENNICVCNSGYNDVNGTCIDKCPGVNNFLLSNGSCSNCNNDDYLQDAQCNCQSINSQLDIKPYVGSIVSIDNILYTQYTASCINGVSFYILVKNLDIVDNNNSIVDYNDSIASIDYNSTSANDYNSTGSITDDNSTAVQNTNYLGQKLDNIGSLTSGLGQKLDNIGSIASDSNSKLLSIDNSLKSISSKNDLINSNLQSLKAVNQNGFNDIGKKIDDVKKEISGDNFTGDLSFDGITDFYNNLQTDIDTISSNYDYYSGIYENGFSTDDFQISSGVNPDFQATVFGKTFDLDLCPIFSTFKPIMYLIFSFVFLFLAVRITWLGIKFNQGSN